MLCAVFAELRSAAPRHVQDDLTSFGSRLRAGLYGVGDGVGALLVPPGAISLLVDADAVRLPDLTCLISVDDAAGVVVVDPCC